MMFSFKQEENGNKFSENKRGQEYSQTFSNDSQISPKTYSPDFSSSVAQMDRIIHQRMKTQFSDSHFLKKPSDYMVDELGLCEDLGKMNFEDTQDRGFGFNPNNGFNLSQCSKNDKSFKDFGSSFSGDFVKSDHDLYKHVLGLREGYFENNFLGSDFSPKNSSPLIFEDNYYKNGVGCSIERGSYNGGPQFDTLPMNRPWSQNGGMSSVGDLNPLNLLSSSNRGSTMDINQVFNGSGLYPNCGSSEENSVYNGSMLYPSRGPSVDTNPVCNGFYPNRASSLGNWPHDVSMLYPSRGSRVENSMCNDLMFYPNRASSVDNTTCNDPMLYANRSLSLQNPVCNDLMFYPNRALNLDDPVCNSSMLYPNRDLSVENMLCNSMVFRDEIIAARKSRGLNHSGDFEASSNEDSLIIEGKSVKCVAEKGQSTLGKGSRGRKKKSHPENVSQNRRGEIMNQNMQSLMSNNPMISQTICGSLYEFRGYVYFIAKDQLGCRFLQRVFEEGHYQDVQIIFNETINHVAELMMDPFANYLIQKMLEVCSEEQRTQIVLMVTARPGELVEICLNVHGTRVVQKLIETLKTRQQKRLVVSALHMRFLELVKDANGYHVIKICLQCLSKEDTKFIFDAAAKCCFDMATHQHGCCILKSCIAQSDGRYRERLVTEIASQGFVLAQDAFGNYVVQHIIELKIPSAAAMLSSQFRGNYVYLAMQKFSSHVVQTFLNSYEKSRPIVIQELVLVPHFEQLLQDPFANYVIQTAIDVSKGPLHDLLVKAVQKHSTLRNSPYCKKLFSGNLLKR